MASNSDNSEERQRLRCLDYTSMVKEVVYIDDVTVDKLRPLLPYLREGSIDEKILKGAIRQVALRGDKNIKCAPSGGNREIGAALGVYVAMPPVMVSDGFRVLEMYYNGGSETVGAAYYHMCSRVKGNYNNPLSKPLINPLSAERYKKTLWTTEAAAFSRKIWDNERYGEDIAEVIGRDFWGRGYERWRQANKKVMRTDSWADFIAINFVSGKNRNGKTEAENKAAGFAAGDAAGTDRHSAASTFVGCSSYDNTDKDIAGDCAELWGGVEVFFPINDALHNLLLKNTNQMNRRNQGKLFSEILNESIIEELITFERGYAMEIKGDRRGNRFSCCARCGGGLLISGCAGCSTIFPQALITTPWACAAPQKIVDFLEENGMYLSGNIEQAKDAEMAAAYVTGPIPNLLAKDEAVVKK